MTAGLRAPGDSTNRATFVQIWALPAWALSIGKNSGSPQELVGLDWGTPRAVRDAWKLFRVLQLRVLVTCTASAD